MPDQLEDGEFWKQADEDEQKIGYRRLTSPSDHTFTPNENIDGVFFWTVNFRPVKRIDVVYIKMGAEALSQCRSLIGLSEQEATAVLSLSI